MDGFDILVGSTGDVLAGRPAVSAAAVALVPAPSGEVEAILAAVPRAHRTNAAWAVPLLLDTARAGGITNLRRIAYVLATAQHSSQFGAGLCEDITTADGSDGERGCDRYEPGTPLGATLGNTQPGDGERFCGRGFVHIRGRAPYATWSQRLGMPDEMIDGVALPFFVAHPAALARPHIAAQTLVRGMRDGLFTGIPLGYYVNDKKTDYFNARRVIDGTKRAREVAETAVAFQVAIEHVHDVHHRVRMQELTEQRNAGGDGRDPVQDVRAAIERLTARGAVMPDVVDVIDWNGEPRQGKFVQLDEHTCALHVGRGTYLRLDIQRDLNGIVPLEGHNMALRRSGEVRSALRHGEVNFWR